MRMTGRRTVARLRTMLVGAAAAAALLVAGLPGLTAPAHAADAPVSGVSLVVSTPDTGRVAPGQPLEAQVAITNGGGTAIESADVAVAITNAPLASRTALDAWLDGSSNAPTRTLGSTAAPWVAPGTTSDPITVTTSPTEVGLTGSTAVYGLRARLRDGHGVIAEAAGVIVWSPDKAKAAVKLTVAVPLTTPPATTGLISADDLAAYTDDNGLLTRELDSVIDQPGVAIGLDPRILASIRVLGTSAPETATRWLARLAQAENEIFPLQYGDADPIAQVQAGLDTLLTPSSFRYALDAADFPSQQEPGEGDESTPTATPSPSTSETSTPAPDEPGNLPTLDELLAWPYTLDGIAWPPDVPVRPGDLTTLAQHGLTTTILGADATDAASLPQAPSLRVTAPGATGLVTDKGVSRALRRAVTAPNETAWNGAMATMAGRLLLTAGDGGGDRRVLLATLGRGDWPADGLLGWRTLSSLDTISWIEPTSLAAALASPPADGVTIGSGTESEQRRQAVSEMAADQKRIEKFSSVLVDPELLSGRTRAEVLSLLGAGWLAVGENWADAVHAHGNETTKLLKSVRIVPPTGVLLVAAQSNIPISVQNTLRYPISVVLEAQPSNGRLDVGESAPHTVQGDSQRALLVPVKARLGNGKVGLALQLHSTTGALIGEPVAVPTSVHADWEGIGALVIGIALVLLFGFGIVRNIVRRRRSTREARAGEHPEPPEPEPESEPEPSEDADG